ncbi:MAG: hypothetical protein JSW23_01125 [Planctomycetota bacterium]|nr:MAG: hypothetical protein JSW23_01125 [Planctomycetota bacterium]
MDKPNGNIEGSEEIPECEASDGSRDGRRSGKEPKTAVLFGLACGLLGFYCCSLICWFTREGVVAPEVVNITTFLILVSGIGAIVSWACKIQSKAAKRTAGVVVVLAVLSFFLPAMQKVKHGGKVVLCQSNLSQLGRAIIAYSESNDGYLPIANEWCDLLMQDNNGLFEDIFKCPHAEEGRSNYAFNDRLSGLRLKDVPSDVVLLFEASGGWNLSGGPESLALRHKPGGDQNVFGRGICNILFTNGDVWCYRVEELIKKPLRWEP